MNQSIKIGVMELWSYDQLKFSLNSLIIQLIHLITRLYSKSPVHVY